jgi:hypothetical protein
MLSGEAAREAPASGGASPYRAGVNAGSGGELRPRLSRCTTAAKHIQRFGRNGRETPAQAELRPTGAGK